MGEQVSTKRIWDNPAARLAIVGMTGLLIGFIAGFVPGRIAARHSSNELAKIQRNLDLSKIQNLLGSAAIDARRGNYEPARQSVSEFFTRLRTEVDQGERSALNESQRQTLAPLFEQRDQLITLLARGDPAAADRVSDLYIAYVKAVPAS